MKGKNTSPESHSMHSDSLTRAPIHRKKNQGATDSQNKSESKVEKQSPKLYPNLNLEDDCDNDIENDDDKCLLPKTSEETSPASKGCKNESTKAQNIYPTITKEGHIDSKSSTTDSKKRYFPKFIFSCFIVLIAVAFIFYVYSSSKPGESNETVINVAGLVARMQNEFQNQPEMTFKSVKRALKSVANMSLEPKSPAIILLAVNKDAGNTGLEFSKSLAHKVVGKKYILIGEDSYLGYNPDNIKINIDEKINQTHKSENLNVIVVDKFEKIPVKAAMLFHNYCDHENAIFKRRVYLFVLTLNNNLPTDANQKYIDEAAQKHLSNLWKDTSSDYFESLITRLTGTVVNIKEI